MQKRKMPAPRRAVTNRGTTDTLAQLDWLRTNRPRTYDRLMIALAELVAIARAIDD